MNKPAISIMLIAAAALTAALAWGLWPKPAAEQATSPSPASSLPARDATAADQESPSLLTEGGPALHPLSMPAFGQREFIGSNFTVGRVLADTADYTRYYITYQSGELTISGIMNVPKGDPPTGGFPLLVLNHGYIDPAIYTNGRGLKREQDYLARQGYVVVHPDYRNHADSSDDPNADRRFRSGYAEDVINAIKAIQAADLSYIDAERVGMLGHSMGGGIAWKIAVTQPDLVDAYVQFAPVSADERDNFEKWIRRRPETAAAIITEHGEPSANHEFWDSISPLTFLENIAVPVMIHHGTADDSVPLAWSERATTELETHGKDVTLHVYPGEPHEFTTAWPQVLRRTTDFFDQHVKSR